MKLYRFQSSILIRLFNAHEPVNGEVLCHEAKMSMNSLRKTIEQMNEECKDSGMQIVSKAGSGFLIEVTDEKRYEDFVLSVTARYHRNQFFRDSTSDTVHYILRYFLSASNVTLADIADSLFVSQSTVSRFMPSVKKHLKDYGLYLVNHTNSGFIVEGPEWRYRLALANEYQIYHDFKIENTILPETSFEQLFLSGGTLRQAIIKSIHDTLVKTNYMIPFDSVREFCDLLILNVTRKKYSRELEKDRDVFVLLPHVDYKPEATMIKDIITSLPESYSIQVNETEMLMLSTFLKASKIIYSEDLANVSQSETSRNLSKTFIQFIESKYHFEFPNSELLLMDLACQITMLMNRCSVGIHKKSKEILSVQADGLLNMDLCIDFYEFFNANSQLKCTAEDALSFYYIISDFMEKYYHSIRKKYCLVSRYGYYYAKNLANRINSLIHNSGIELFPLEYLQLDQTDLSQFQGIATDIDEIRKANADFPVYMIHYMRRNEEMIALADEIIYPKSDFTRWVFRQEDVLYADHLKSMKDVYAYISNLFENADSSQKAMYEKSLKEQFDHFSPIRKHDIMLIHERHQCVPENLFKIIVLKNHLVGFKNERIRLIIVINVKDQNLDLLHQIYDKVANLLHAEDLKLTGVQNQDYELLLDVMYRHMHLM